MVKKFNPEINKVYFINKYTLFHILSGTGSIQVDFKNYVDWMDKAIYLEKGQYIKFLSDDFLVRTIEFPNKQIFDNKDVRVLFKHLISLGYINFNECTECQKYLSETIFEENTKEIINVSLKQWFWQNPFNASKNEYQVIFDAKEMIDQEFYNHLTNKDLEALLRENGYQAHSLVRDKLGITLKTMLEEKRLVESKKEVVFTDKHIQEVSYEMGFKDPAYFNRVFKKGTGYSPTQFRENFDYDRKDSFVEDLTHLLRKHHAKERSLGFYADKMNLSVKALAKKTKDKMNDSLGRLIRNELINTSKKLLNEDTPVKEVSIYLGFEEPNHFSTFFKHHTGINPSEFIHKKVQENTPFL
ncbi:transcriptional regulator, AraC family [Allomuricauda ruestringensis DSM 13258]|uniref:Transcriptional regulator, AraC family n=1 Tax=Allomuricauda ruestringensis (strain DSM 13258 / CIP 107369 / LMG 19739 / B1) TaxID=886377 RepID=G2PNV1_ALLRU|nr:AraC family transcriptional regulator [Allomuricauda ruestringensis]AEM70286.1 transcriptional regulator, AraC family [Allomuricauda ruestringensis DSM 13258]